MTQTDSNKGFFSRLAEPESETGPSKRRIGRWVRRRFAVGVLVAFPLVVTLFFARFIFGLLDRWFLPISERVFGVRVPGIGFVLFLIVLFGLGIAATNILGGRVLEIIERRIARVPLLSPVYQSARQITEAIQIRGNTDFRKVVLLDFPRTGLRSLGFVTREFAEPTAFCEQPSALVFVPTTPNPTTGFLVALPQRDLDVLDISVDQGVKLLISGGLLTPPQMRTRSAASAGSIDPVSTPVGTDTVPPRSDLG
jgi:uncharacterized membrane protein